jgi:carboxymethylenebutenolidase
MTQSSTTSLSLHQWIEINVGDKTMPTWVCTPMRGKPKAAVVVIQEIYGVNSHIRLVAERLAAEGYLTLAPDLFHRGGNRFEGQYSEPQAAMARAQKMSDEQALHDIDRVIANLDMGLKIGVVGFCMGGRLAFQASFNPRVSAAVSFYGTQIVEKALQWTKQIHCPLLMFFGEKDAHNPPEAIANIREALEESHKTHEIVVFPGAGHAFFCEERASYNEEAARDAWHRTLGFLAARFSAGSEA